MRKFLLSWLPLILVILMGCGCTSVQNVIEFPHRSSPLTLNIEQVEPAGQPGTYTLRGKATLPDKTQLSVSAIRSFDPSASTVERESTAVPFVILDRQFAQVENGAWQTSLNLWQVGSDGQYRESWQLNQPTPPSESGPSPTVTFLVTLEPDAFSRTVDLNSVGTPDELGDALLSFTEAGEPYLRVGQRVAVALPTGKAQAGQLALEQAENPWEGRSNLNAAAADFDRVPVLPFDENDNLPLPQSNMLR